MNIKQLISQFRIMPPHITIKKVMEKILSRFRLSKLRKADLNSSTFPICPDWLNLPSNNIIEIRNIPLLRDYEKEIFESANNSINHKFDLLGSGLVKVHFGMKTNGWEGNKYYSKKNYKNTSDLLERSVTPSNFIRSSEILCYISQGYEPIDWQIDFKSGFRWNPLDWSPDIRYGNAAGTDIKLPWEIGRMQHLPVLAFASVLQNNTNQSHSNQSHSNQSHSNQSHSNQSHSNPTASNKYLTEIEGQILDFIAFNPPRFGTQWMSAMDVAIRAANWIVTYNLIVNSKIKFSDWFDQIFKESIYAHGRHIMANLEWSSGMRGNHYLANITGIIFISTFLPDSTISDLWLLFALQELSNEILHQFNADGGNFEASTAYHLFSAEMVFFVLRLIDKIPSSKFVRLNSLKFSDWKYEKKLLSLKKQKFAIEKGNLIFSPQVIDRLNSIIKFTSSVIDANGRIPQIGDNDSGYLLRLTPAVSNLDGNIFNSLLNKDCRTSTGRKYIETELAGHSYDTDIRPAAKPLVQFGDFGLYIYNKENYKLTIRCGSIGQNGKGGHSHNDQLSFVLNYKGEDFFVDPGAYVYTASAEMRNLFRSTESHNTLIIKGLEQNTWHDYSKDDLFWIAKDSAKAKAVSINEGGFVGVHHGYRRQHRREFRIFDDSILINDICKVKGVKLLKYHLHPSVIIQAVSDSNVQLNCKGIIVDILFNAGRIEIDEYRYSTGYGKVEMANFIAVEFVENSIETKLNLIR